MQPNEKSVNCSLIAYLLYLALVNLFTQICMNSSRFESVNLHSLIPG